MKEQNRTEKNVSAGGMKMNTKDSKVVLFDSDEAAHYRTNLSGWISRHGHFWGNDERAARYDGCTHTHCEDCGGIVLISLILLLLYITLLVKGGA